jgi:hypothetical protein
MKIQLTAKQKERRDALRTKEGRDALRKLLDQVHTLSTQLDDLERQRTELDARLVQVTELRGLVVKNANA